MVHIQEPTSIHHFLEFADRVATDALTHARDFQFPRHNIPPASEFRVNSVEGAFIGIVPLLKKAFFVFGTGVILLCVSLAAYGLFYLAVMPSHHATEPLFFDYSGISKHPAPVCVDDNLERTDHQLLPRHLKSTPWAVADLFSKQTQWEAYSKDVVPNPITDTRILKERSAYYIDIVLDLPESDVNRMSGMFGVLVELQSSNGRKLAHSVRAARLPHESSWISSMRKFILLVPLMIGAIQENRRVIVPSFRHYVESSESPLQYVTVRLIMKDGLDNEIPAEFLEVTKGEIRIGKELTDFQFLLKEWFFTCYMVGAFFIFSLQILGLLIGRLYWDYRATRRMQEDPSINLNLDNSSFGSQFEPANESPVGSQDRDDDWEDLPPQSPENNEQLDATGDRPPTPNTTFSNILNELSGAEGRSLDQNSHTLDQHSHLDVSDTEMNESKDNALPQQATSNGAGASLSHGDAERNTPTLSPESSQQSFNTAASRTPSPHIEDAPF